MNAEHIHGLSLPGGLPWALAAIALHYVAWKILAFSGLLDTAQPLLGREHVYQAPEGMRLKHCRNILVCAGSFLGFAANSSWGGAGPHVVGPATLRLVFSLVLPVFFVLLYGFLLRGLVRTATGRLVIDGNSIAFVWLFGETRLSKSAVTGLRLVRGAATGPATTGSVHPWLGQRGWLYIVGGPSRKKSLLFPPGAATDAAFDQWVGGLPVLAGKAESGASSPDGEKSGDVAMALPPAPAREPGAPLVTLALLGALGVVYVAELIVPGALPGQPSALILLGDLDRTLVVGDGQWYRLVTATFLHQNMFHLLMNGFVLFFCGKLLEGRIGPAWFLALYAAGGLAGSCLSLALAAPHTASIGASGAIMGVLAGVFVMTFRDPAGPQRRRVRLSLARLLIPALLPQAIARHIDVHAHLGGAIAGALLALVILQLCKKGDARPRCGRLALVVPCLALPLLLIGLPSGIALGGVLLGLADEHAGRLAEADGAFSLAMRLDPRSSDSLGERAVVRFQLRRYEESADDFRALGQTQPDWAYAPLLAYLASLRAGGNARAELAADAQHLDLSVWPGPAVALFLGQTTPQAVFGTAARAEAQNHQHQSCEAAFYLGEWSFTQGRIDEGRSLLQRATDTCPASFIEYRLARAEMARMSVH